MSNKYSRFTAFGEITSKIDGQRFKSGRHYCEFDFCFMGARKDKKGRPVEFLNKIRAVAYDRIAGQIKSRFTNNDHAHISGQLNTKELEDGRIDSEILVEAVFWPPLD